MSRGLQGLRAWVIQRLSAVFLGLFFLYAVAYVFLKPGMSFTQWTQWVTGPAMLMALGLFYLALGQTF